MQMNNIVYPNWQTFAYKYQGQEEDAFEDLARMLFRKEMGIQYGIFQRINHTGNETDVIEKDGKIIGFQSKYFTKSINDSKIIESMKKAKTDNPEQTHYYIYCNLSFGNSISNKNAKQTPIQHKTKKEENIESEAKKLGLTIVWKLNKAILDEVVVNKTIYDIFFNVHGKLESLIKNEKTHTEVAFNSVHYFCSYKDNNIHINRDNIITQIVNLTPSTIFVIHGDGGCGKTAILREFFDKYGNDYPVCYRKASSLDVRNIAEVFHLDDTYSFNDFIDAYTDYSRKYFIIDSAEHLDELKDDTVLPTILKRLLENNWCVIFTVRNVFAGDLLNLLAVEIPKSQINRTEIGVLTERDIKELSCIYEIEMPKDPNLIDRIKNLFYFSLYTQYYSEIDSQSSDSTFLKLVWDRKIKGKNNRKGYIRENEFEAFITERIQTGAFFIPSEKFTSAEFYTLVEDEIIANDPTYGLYVAHDIFEEWGMYRIVDKKWKESNDVISFLNNLGDARVIRRAFRLWLKDKATENPETITTITQAAFSSELPGLWKEEVLCALLLSDKAELFFRPHEESILKNNGGLGSKIAWALRVGGKYITKVVQYKDYFIPYYSPIGSGWEYIIDLLFRNQNNFEMFLWLPVIHDWTISNQYGETTRKAGLMMVAYYQSSMSYGGRYNKQNSQLICKIINNAVCEIKDELSNLLHLCISNEDLSDDLPQFILENNFNAVNIHLTIPETVISLCLSYWMEDEREKNKHSQFANHMYSINRGFGIDEYGVAFKYFPSGAMQTPMFTLLKANEKLAIDFLINLMNKCMEKYSKLTSNEYCTKVKIKDEHGIVNWQWHSVTLWTMYRGMQDSPYTLQSLHMALEKYLLDLSEAGKYEQCEHILKRLLFECHSSSVSAITASLVLAYPDQYWNVAMILFRTLSFFHTDLSRSTSEFIMESTYRTSWELNPPITDERIETCKQEFRKSNLELACLYYQFYKNPKLSEEQNHKRILDIYKIIDEHRRTLEQNKDNGHNDIETMLSKIDRRRLDIKNTKKVEAGILIEFDVVQSNSSNKAEEDTLVNKDEITKYLELTNWAIAKTKGEKPSNNIYSDNIEHIINDARNLQHELDKGRIPYLVDNQILPIVAQCFIKFYNNVISIDDKQWCKEIIDNALAEFIKTQNYTNSISTCINILPLMIEEYPEEKEHYANIMFNCLCIPDYGANSSSKCAATGIHYFELWEKEPELMNDILIRFLDYANSQQEKAYEIHKLQVILELIPNKPNKLAVEAATSCLNEIPVLLSVEHNLMPNMIMVVDSIVKLLMKTDSQEILSCLPCTNNIVKEYHLGGIYLRRIVEYADSYRNPDRFWKIWNSYRTLFIELIKNRRYEQLYVYTFQNIPYKDGIKEWHTLRPQDIDFFNFLAENSDEETIIFDGLVKVLTTIGSNFKTEGMGWLAKAINKCPTMVIKESQSLMHLELMMMPYVYANKMQIRKTPNLLNQVRTVLNFMVSNNSATGYMLRDLVN